MGQFNIPIIDYSGESTVASLHVDDNETDLNLTALFTAVDGITLGNLAQSKHVISINKNKGIGGNATSKYAQRETKWLCRYHDAVTLKKRTLEIGAAENQLISANTDFMNMADGAAGQAFKTAFDAHVTDPETGNAVVLDSVELVGRK